MVTHKCNKEREIGTIIQKIDDLSADFKEVKAEIRENSSFRLQSKSVIGFAAFIFAAFGGFIMWTINKLSLK